MTVGELVIPVLVALVALSGLGVLVVAVVNRATPMGRAPSSVARPAIVEAAPDVTPSDAIADLQHAALERLPMGLLLYADDGTEVYRNRAAGAFLAPRVSGPLLSAQIAASVAGARKADAAVPMVESTLELYGPPKRSFQLSVHRLGGGEADDGRPLASGLAVVVSDTTEKDRIDAVRRDFVANVSHELKTPVAALGLLAEALTDEDDPATSRRLAGRLQGESLRLANTIDDLLALSEIESDELIFSRVSAAEIRSGVENRSAAVAEQRGIELTWTIEPSDLWLMGDRRQLVSAVGNVVDNALKYSEPKSAVSVAMRLDDERDGERPDVTITVVDEGIGIPEADRERIFERFYRVDPARSRSTGGTGLGLSIVRHVLLNHAGTVQLDSTEGVGTTFVLRIPQLPAEEVTR